MSERRIIGLLACVAAALVVGLPGASAKPTEVVTLRLMWATALQGATDIMIKNFERVYPDIKIDVQYLAPSAIEPLLLTQFKAGSAPDLFFIKAGRIRSNGVWPMAEAGYLLDLGGSKWEKRVYPPMKPFVKWNGKTYSWPMGVIPYGVLYNVDLFNQLGLKVPTRFSEVLAMCRKINAAGKIPFIQGFNDSGTTSIVSHILVANDVWSVDAKWNEKRLKKQVTFATSPGWRTLFQSVLDLKNADCFQTGAAGSSRAQIYARMANGEAVMTMEAASDIPNILAVNPNIHMKMMNLPPADPKNATLSLITTPLISGNANTKYPAQVRTFIAFLAREQQSALYARVSQSLSSLQIKKLQLPDWMKPNLTALMKAGKFADQNEAAWPVATVWDTGIAASIQGLITGQLTVDDALAKADQLWDAG